LSTRAKRPAALFYFEFLILNFEFPRRASVTPCLRGNFLLPSVFCLLTSLLIGCHHAPPAEGKTATDIDPKYADPRFYWDKPGVVRIPARDFDRLWVACRATCRQYLFRIDRLDYREGVMTSVPTITSQFFEPWRRDNSTGYDVAQSSIATFRRTIRFEIARKDDGTFELTPKVLLEREVLEGRRITAAIRYQTAFSGEQPGSAHDHEDQPAAITFWYATGRDYDLEKRLADSVLSNLY
jgi:hypothetical protein